MYSNRCGRFCWLNHHSSQISIEFIDAAIQAKGKTRFNGNGRKFSISSVWCVSIDRLFHSIALLYRSHDDRKIEFGWFKSCSKQIFGILAKPYFETRRAFVKKNGSSFNLDISTNFLSH